MGAKYIMCGGLGMERRCIKREEGYEKVKK